MRLESVIGANHQRLQTRADILRQSAVTFDEIAHQCVGNRRSDLAIDIATVARLIARGDRRRAVRADRCAARSDRQRQSAFADAAGDVAARIDRDINCCDCRGVDLVAERRRRVDDRIGAFAARDRHRRAAVGNVVGSRANVNHHTRAAVRDRIIAFAAVDRYLRARRVVEDRIIASAAINQHFRAAI